jgi:sarcosine oxidase subunit beta
MTKTADIVIIGGGVVGASVAYHLAQRGERDVLILERESRPATGSTGRATGGVRAQFETEVNIKLSLYSIDFFENWGRDCGYDPKGYLFFATTDDQFAYLKDNVAKQRSLGVKDIAVLERAEIKSLVPILNCDDIVGGTFGGRDGFIDPLAVSNSFLSEALNGGVRTEFGSEVTRIETDGQKVRAVMAGDDRIECKAVALCTGAWARRLAATAGIDLPVEPQRRQIVWARTAQPLPKNLPMVIDIGSGFHFRPAREFGVGTKADDKSTREVMFAYPDPAEGPSFVTDFDYSFVPKVYERAKERAPVLCDSEPVPEKCRAGLYENTPDHHAILGGCGIEGLYFANGFSGHGVMHSPATGRALSEIILDGASSFLDVSELTVERFGTGRLLHETAFI